MKYLITGGCGFLGTNLSARVLERGEDLVIFDNLSKADSPQNLQWLQEQGTLTFQHGDIRNAIEIDALVKKMQPDVVFHLAGQVAMTSSIENPKTDFEINALGTLHLLEAVRHHSPHSAIIFSSTNKVYGNLEGIPIIETETRYSCPDFPNGFGESMHLEFRSPYACSKGSADQYVLDYARIFDLRTAVFRHSSIYGARQFPTSDQGWIGWFCQQSLETQANPHRDPFTICGSGKKVRDVLFASDAVDVYFAAAEKIDEICGEAFNIGGGMENSLSLLELFTVLENSIGTKLHVEKLPWRSSDQKFFVADNTKVTGALHWQPKVSSLDGVQKMIEWLINQHQMV